MPCFEENVQALVDGLFSQDQLTRLTSIRRIKNAIIGNQTKKSSFRLLGVIPSYSMSSLFQRATLGKGLGMRLVGLVSDENSSKELISEAIITLGSFAHGTSENVQAVLSAKALPHLIKGLCHDDPAVVSACIRTLRTLYSSELAPSDMIFSNVSVPQKLVSLMSASPQISQCASIVLAKACQDPDHQNLLCSHGITDVLCQCVHSSMPKVIHAALQCLSSVVYENKTAASMMAEASYNGNQLISVLTKILSSNHGHETKLASARCLTYLCRAGAISSDSPVVTLKVLPSLIRLCKRKLDMELRADATGTLAYLIQPYRELQLLAADSDRLITTLVEYLQDRPDENDDLVQEKHLNQFDRLRESVFLALAGLGSNREEIRLKIVSERNMLKSLSEGLNGDNVNIKITAMRCLHSLSRSTKLLRTNLADYSVWKPCLSMLSLRDEECLVTATGVACNLLLEFSPSREKLLEGGALEVLAELTTHDNSTIQLNALWALMSASYQADTESREKLKLCFGYSRLFNFLSPQSSLGVVMKALGMLINLTQDGEETESLMVDHGAALLGILVSLLQDNSNEEKSDQVVCLLGNLSGCSVEKVKDILAGCDDLMRAVARILQTSKHTGLLMGVCQLVKNLADTSVPDCVHRQNCLEEHGIKVLLQKLEKIDHYQLQQHVKNALDQFISNTL